jgi:hypothetical protein
MLDHDTLADLRHEARQDAIDLADPLPAELDEDGDPTGPWTCIDYEKSDAAIAEAARLIEAYNAAKAERAAA